MGLSKDTPQESRDWQLEASPDEVVGYPLLSDSECVAAKALGVYDHAHDMALPAIVLVDGHTLKVVWTYVGESIADRPEAEQVLEQAKALRAKQLAADE